MLSNVVPDKDKKIKWADRISNKVLGRVDEEISILTTILRREKDERIGHILWHDFIEGKVKEPQVLEEEEERFSV